MLGSRLMARGVLELLWDPCYESGDDYIGTSEDLEMLVGWTGEPGMLTRALVEAGAPEGQGFIEPVPGTAGGAVAYKVHDLFQNAPEYVANRRSKEQERRKEKTCDRCGTVYFAADARSRFCSSACKQGGWRDRRNNSLPSVTVTNVTETDRNGTPAPAPAPITRTQHPTPAKSGSAEPPKRVSTPAANLSPVILKFPVTGPGGPVWTLHQGQIDHWRSLYPGLDVLAEARKALAWIEVNTGRRKTVPGMPRFIVNWLSRAANSGGARNRAAEAQQSAPDWEVTARKYLKGEHR